MEYRTLPHGGEKISVLGLGMGYISGTQEEITETVDAAIKAGINFFDLAASEKAPFAAYARAFEGRREQVMTQMHFGAVYDDGKYGWTQNLDDIKRTFQWELNLFGTDYTDIGMLHCIDEKEDLQYSFDSGLWDYMKHLKAEGQIRHLGFSTHNPDIARRLLDTELIDLFMFSLNPAYDIQKGDYAMGDAGERAALYRESEALGVGISVMKPFAGGQLLDDKLSPFEKSLSRIQCIQYALDCPAVLTVLPGIRNRADLTDILAYTYADEEAKDYSAIGQFTAQSMDGVCVYCNHCQPCPAGLDVGMINKYYDLAKAGDAMAASHYQKLEKTAADCIKCGHCQHRCPFSVKQEARMEEIAEYFGK